jgi:hypothetical protein
MSGYIRSEQMLSAVLLITALEWTFQNRRFVPRATKVRRSKFEPVSVAILRLISSWRYLAGAP